MKKLIINLLLVATILTARKGVNYFNGQKETWYNLPMTRVMDNADKVFGSHHKRWTDERGVKYYGTYIIVAAPYDVHPYGSNVETSLGTGIVLDTGAFAETNKDQIDIATAW